MALAMRPLEPGSRFVPGDHVDHSTLSKADNPPAARNLHAVDEFAVRPDDVVNRAASGAGAYRAGADPEVAVCVAAGGSLRKDRAIIRQLTRTHEIHLRS